MYILDENVLFDRHDAKFIQKFGAEEAARMALDYASRNATPFIYDVSQLMGVLGLSSRAFSNLIKDPDRHYTQISIPKRSGGLRTLSVPDGCLKDVQRIILDRIIAHIPVSRFARAYYPGAALSDNAAPHVGRRYVLKLDVEDFFGSITFVHVLRFAFNTERYPAQTGFMLTKLCCFREALPQGAPTSPALSNVVMRAFDDNLGGWCGRHGITYTRYCDDMTFSGDRNLYFVIDKVRGMLEDTGMELNGKKTRMISRASRQTVTGLTVNGGVRVPRDYKRELRKEIYYVLKYGVGGHVYRNTGKWFKGDRKRYIGVLVGKCAHVLNVEPDNAWFRDARDRLTEWL